MGVFKPVRTSLEGKLTAVVLVLLALVGAATAGAAALTGSGWLGWLFGVTAGLPLALVALRRFMRPVNEVLQALVDGTSSLSDSDFSISIAETRRDELGELVRAYNSIGRILRDERQDLFQRELLLDTVIQTTPLALLLVGPTGAIIYSNTAARQLFLEGRKLEGLNFETVLGEAPEALRQAVESGQDGLFTIESMGGKHAKADAGTGPETFHLSQKRFVLNARGHRLLLFKHLTRELSRQEVATWKRVIRVIGHELNNSLAPLSSLAHSGQRLTAAPDPERLRTIFTTIEERTRHLQHFIEGYARFARLPRPDPRRVDWRTFVASLTELARFRPVEPFPEEPGWFDAGQMEQVLINLVKNAVESGSDPDDVHVSVEDDGQAQRIVVADRGSGMSRTVLNNALLPFYSTKRTGTGLGLPLCREVVEAHDGRLALNNREGGGLRVSIWLPRPPDPAP